MNQQPIHGFIARGSIVQDANSIPVIVSGSYAEYGPFPVRCKVMPEIEKGPSSINLFDEINPTQLTATAEDDETVWISALSEVSVSHNRGQTSWEGIADFFLKGNLDEFDATGGEIVCSIFIPPTPLAIADVNYIPSYDGTIRMREDKTREGIRWNTKFGQAELIDNYANKFSLTKIGRAHV